MLANSCTWPTFWHFDWRTELPGQYKHTLLCASCGLILQKSKEAMYIPHGSRRCNDAYAQFSPDLRVGICTHVHPQ